jgi:enoyl-CoA hydratase/carnithine racemase
MADDSRHVRFSRTGRIGTITLDRPARLNAIGLQTRAELADALKELADDPDLRVGILTGAGRAFSAGADLKEMAELNAASGRRWQTPSLEQAVQFSRHPKPIIAAINGLCFAGGLERALECDIRIAVPGATFALPEVKRGIIAGYAVHHLTKLIPFGQAMHLLLTGETITAEDALRVGLIQEVVPADSLLVRAVALAETIAANAPLAVEGTKAIAQWSRQSGLDDSYRMGEWVNRFVLGSNDAKEGPRAFAEKRAPKWTGT